MSADSVEPLATAAPQRWRQWQLAATHANPTVRALMWSAASGLSFCLLNALSRKLTIELDPMQAQFLRYLFGIVVLLPLVWRQGLAAYRPLRPGGQFLRGAVHALGLMLWYTALPQIPLADSTAIGFTGPIFIMIGAFLFLGEPMRWERWLATTIGLAGVMIVLVPKLLGGGSGGGSSTLSGGHYHLLMLASAPVFAASFLLTKALTRYETPGVIVLWQAISVTLFSLPLALLHWQTPNASQWLGFFFCGLLGTAGHYFLTRSFRAADISATQSVKFLDLVWASLLGWMVFADLPTQSTLIGGAVICAATLWVARRESRQHGRTLPIESTH